MSVSTEALLTLSMLFFKSYMFENFAQVLKKDEKETPAAFEAFEKVASYQSAALRLK